MINFHELSSIDVGGNTQFSFPTIQAALKYISGLRRNGVKQPISIRLVSDQISLAEPIKIGNDVYGITIEPDGDKRVTVLGGVEITGFEWDTYNGARCLSAPLPDVCKDENGVCNFTDFFVNGKRASFTRYPAEGHLLPEDVENHGTAQYDSSKWFIAKEGDFRNFRNMERIQISFCHLWIDEHTPIESYDPETRKVTFAYRSRFTIAGDENVPAALRYYLENVGEMFANPNEWYADEGKVYYIPRDESITPETIRAYAPTLSKIVDVCGTPDNHARNIRFRNIDFAVSRGEYASVGHWAETKNEGIVAYASDAQAVCSADGSLTFKYAANCSLESCTLKNFGVHGIVIDLGCHNIRVDSCDMFDGGASGIKVVGGNAYAPEHDATHDNVIDNCTVLYCGRRYFAACGMLLMDTFNNTVSHNEIGHMYYTGVSVGWVWGYTPSTTHDNLITKNHIHDLGGGIMSDMGGVYLLGFQPGTVVSNNVIHDVNAAHYGGWALYTDEGSSYITLENNICYNTFDNCYHQHYGSMNTVRNNIFAFSKGPMVAVSRDEPHLSIIFERNISYSAGTSMYVCQQAHWMQKTISTSHNLFFDATREDPEFYKDCFGHRINFAEAQAYGLEEGSIIADPLFKDPAKYDFTLAENSPAFDIGFKPIDTSDVGPRR